MVQKSKTAIQPFDEARAVLTEVGIDLETELLELDESVNGNMLPRVRIEHRDNGKHRMYFDMGESYLDSSSDEIPVPGNKLEAIVIAHQHIRALWKEGDIVPTCSALNELPNVSEPLATKCSACEHSQIGKGLCKPKVRLLLLTEVEGKVQPVIFTLSPTSIKHWQAHLRRLKRSGLPPIVVNTVFTLEDIKKNGYRWAEVNIGINGVASKELLIQAKQLRDEYREYLSRITESDFADAGDRIEEEFGF